MAAAERLSLGESSEADRHAYRWTLGECPNLYSALCGDQASISGASFTQRVLQTRCLGIGSSSSTYTNRVSRSKVGRFRVEQSAGRYGAIYQRQHSACASPQ